MKHIKKPISKNIIRSIMKFPSVELRLEDWQKIRVYYSTLEREVRYLCLAHGKTKKECKAE